MNFKDFLRSGFRTFLSLAGLAWLFPGFVAVGDILSLPIAALVLTVINILIKPILKLLLLPLNVLSFGMFHWVINVITLFLLTLLVDQVQFRAFVFPGFNQFGISLPQVSFSALGSLIVGSFLVTFIRKAVIWLLHSDD
jgi:putative membrane protein